MSFSGLLSYIEVCVVLITLHQIISRENYVGRLLILFPTTLLAYSSLFESTFRDIFQIAIRELVFAGQSYKID